MEINPLQTRINITGGSVGADDQGIAKNVFDKNWHHLVAMIKNGEAIFYLDGQFHAKDRFVAPPKENDINLVLGATSKLSDVYQGLMDEIYIFNRALSESEVLQLYKTNEL